MKYIRRKSNENNSRRNKSQSIRTMKKLNLEDILYMNNNDESAGHEALMTLAVINGIITFADELREVLRSNDASN